jgi:hypothetical protein
MKHVKRRGMNAGGVTEEQNHNDNQCKTQASHL